MRKKYFLLLAAGCLAFFWGSMVFAEALNTIVVLRDGNRIRSLVFDTVTEYTDEGMVFHDASRRLRDLNIAAFRFTRNGERFFVPVEEARRIFSEVEFVSIPGPPYGVLSMRITPRKGEPFEVERAALIRHVGDEFPSSELSIEKYVAYEGRWQRDYLPMDQVREIHFVQREKKKESLEEERVLVGAPLTGTGHSVEALTGLLVAMTKAGNKAGRLSFEILFAINSDKLTPASRMELDRLAAALRDTRLAGTRFRIGGHTDSTGQAAYNMNLSRKRAASVRNYLVQQGGIEAYRLEAAGYGDTRPVASNETPEGRRSNRRVEIEFLPPSGSAAFF
ncbi:OmpA family protein [Desulfobotulus mexicanus]|nr:OmpA family protein [Desulfobotulus mexicanus]